MPHREIRFEGLTEQEILDLPKGEIEALVLVAQPLVFRAGSAVILGSFRLRSKQLIIELAQIEGGGEGVLISLASLAKRYASLNGLREIEWIVHAVSCAKPNHKLRRVLERRGFVVRHVEGVGDAYHLVETI
ncbi:MAG: hypothetical protein ACLQBK_08800 [Candidatus Sulfotelmatobacter sp.]